MLKGILRYLGRAVKPETVPRCVACGEEIPGKPIVFDGEQYDKYYCIPAVKRVHRAEVDRERIYREAQMLEIARKAGL